MIAVRQTFNDSLQAREWEEKALRRLGVLKSNRWLNRRVTHKEFGGPLSETTREKLRKPKSKSHCEAISKAKVGITFSAAHRAALSISKRGEPASQASRAKNSSSKRGKPKSKSHCEAISKGKRGVVTILDITTRSIQKHHSRRISSRRSRKIFCSKFKDRKRV